MAGHVYLTYDMAEKGYDGDEAYVNKVVERGMDGRVGLQWIDDIE